MQFGAADLVGAHEVDVINNRRMDREDSLHPDAVGYFAHGNRRAGFRAMLGRDNCPLKYLDAFFLFALGVEFFYFLVDFYYHAGFVLCGLSLFGHKKIVSSRANDREIPRKDMLKVCLF